MLSVTTPEPVLHPAPTPAVPAAGLLAGRRLLITGVLTESSIAFAVARIAQEQGATVVLTSPPRTVSLTTRVGRRLPEPVAVLPLDVTDAGDLDGLAGRLAEHLDGVDGVLHAIGYAPPAALGNGLLAAGWPDVATALHTSTYSLAALARACAPLLARPARLVGLTFDSRVAWPAYDWMGVAKAALEATARYLARDLGPQGISVNLVAAGPLRTTAARHIPGFGELESAWGERAPLGWDSTDPAPAARACAVLLSDWFGATTGEVVHVDGGAHAVGG